VNGPRITDPSTLAEILVQKAQDSAREPLCLKCEDQGWQVFGVPCTCRAGREVS